ncbi:TPA: hypothetical protein QDA86_004969 [Burkholderia vietnamiensis]|nr:hypothetical protein [Burkholderia vietnamiensis]
MHKYETATPQMARAAEHIHLLTMIASGVAVVIMIVGCVIAHDRIELLAWTGVAAWALLLVAVCPFLAGANAGSDHA